MKLRITAKQTKGQGIPLDHIYALQSAVLGILPENISRRLHSEGLKSRFSGKVFRPYNLSRLLFGRDRQIKDGLIISKKDIAFYVSSHNEEVLNVIANSLFKKGCLKIGQNELEVESIELVDWRKMCGIGVKTASPVIVMDRVKAGSGYRTIFYSPFDDVFAKKISRNLKEKLSAVSDIPLDDIEAMDFDIKPLKVRKEVVKYKDMFLTAYSGDFFIKGTPELIKTAFDLGIGNRSAYSGCIIA